MDKNSICVSTISKMKSSYKDEPLHTCIHLLQKLIKNIISNPNEPKFRNVKKTNEAIKTKILCIKEAETLLKEVGFVEDGTELLVYKDSNTNNLSILVKQLEEVEKEIDERKLKNEILQKNLEAKKLQDEINARMKEEHRKKAELEKLIENDKKERMNKEKAKDSNANDLKFGCNLKKFEAPKNRG